MTCHHLPPVHACYPFLMGNSWIPLPSMRTTQTGRRWVPLGRATPSRRNYKIGWCSTRNSAMTRTSSTHLQSTLPPPLFPVSTPPRRSTPISHGSSQVFSSRLSSRVYYAIHNHLRRSTFCLQRCLQMQHLVQCNLLGLHSAGKCLSLLLTWSCVLLPSHLLPAAWPGCNIWFSSVPSDTGSTLISFLISVSPTPNGCVNDWHYSCNIIQTFSFYEVSADE